jgi:hypothetical protein
MAPDVITFRTQALVEMIKVSTSIRTIDADLRYNDNKLFQESVVPYLETNRLRPRVLAIQKTRPIAYRAKVLGRALLATRTDANKFWMLLSGNAEIAFPSRTPTIAAAANLPSPATATSALTTTAAGILPADTAAAATRAAIPSSTSDAVTSTPAVTDTATNVASPSAYGSVGDHYLGHQLGIQALLDMPKVVR